MKGGEAATPLMYFNASLGHFTERSPCLLHPLPQRTAAGAGGYDFMQIAATRRGARTLLQDVAL